MTKQTVTSDETASPLVVHVPAALPSGLGLERDGYIKADIELPGPHAVGTLDTNVSDILLKEGYPPDYIQSFQAFIDDLSRQTRALTKTALEEFCNQNTQPTDFIFKYGLFRRSAIVSTSGQHQEVWHCRFNKHQFNQDRKELRALLGIWSAVREGRLQDAKGLAAEANLDFAGEPAQALRFGIESHLSGRILEVSGQDGVAKFAGPLVKLSVNPGPPPQVVIKCEDVLSGLYALLLRAVVFLTPWVLCRCGNPFQLTGQRKYCSPRCQKAEKAKRSRQKEAAKIKVVPKARKKTKRRAR